MHHTMAVSMARYKEVTTLLPSDYAFRWKKVVAFLFFAYRDGASFGERKSEAMEEKRKLSSVLARMWSFHIQTNFQLFSFLREIAILRSFSTAGHKCSLM